MTLRGYSDNSPGLRVADRLTDEIERNPSSLDIVTGYIAPSAWGVIGTALAKVRAARILLGKDYQLARADAAVEQANIASLVEEAIRTESTPSALARPSDAATVETALAFLRRDEVQVRVWTDGFLHAKAYLCPDSAGVGSANLTAGGLTANRELVAWREDRVVLDELRTWFEGLWTDGARTEDYKARLIEAIERTAFGGYEYTPYDVLIKTLAELYGDTQPPSLEAATFVLKWFQEEAVFRLIQMLDQPAHGALLADAVGLGKTYMALGVIHHVLYNLTRPAGSGPPVLVMVPASLIPMWERTLREYGLFWACRVESLQSMDRERDVSAYVGAQLVVIDEAHRLRGRGVWYRQVMRILTEGTQDKQVLLLTATPINTSIHDLIAMLQVLTKNRRNVYAPAIADFEAYLRRVEKGEVDPFPVLDRSVVRRSRSDIVREYEERLASGLVRTESPQLPERSLFHSSYRYRSGDGPHVFDAFADALRHLRLAPYDLDAYRMTQVRQETLPGAELAPASELAALVAAGLLKRFESSLEAVRLSLRRLDVVLRRSAELLALDPPRLLRLDDSPRARALVQEERDADDDDVEGLDERWQAVVEQLPPVEHPEELDLDAIAKAVVHDRAAIAELLKVLPDAADDGKIAELRALFQPGGRLVGKRCLLFSQFRDTAVYVHRALSEEAWRVANGLGSVALLHGGSDPRERADVAGTFDPEQAGAGALDQMRGQSAPPQLLVSTDILAEGHNLQLAEAVVNVDLPWNPQVAVQRAGRVDRLQSPHARVVIGSFVPEEGLERHIGLIEALDRRFRLIHLLGLGDEPVTKFRGDVQRQTFEQMRRLYTDDDVSVLDEIERTWTLGSTDYMRAPLEAFLAKHAREKLRGIPLGVQSVKSLPKQGWPHGPGALVVLTHQNESFWRFYPRSTDGWGHAVVDETAIFRAISCREGERRLPLDDPFPGPGGVIDWDLLLRAATEVADALTRRRATSAIQRGASERSRRARERVLRLGDVCGDVEDLDLLLDRLEEVRIEDYDHRAESRGFCEALRAAERAATAGERHEGLSEVVSRGLALFGTPHEETAGDTQAVRPEELHLVAWEVLLGPPTAPQATQMQLGA